MPENIRVRFAPSPTGPLHIGGVRTALYNYLFARKHNGTFILRIEDTDQNRYVEGAEDYIRESLKWLGIMYDEGPGLEGPYKPYRQSERKDSYAAYAKQLVESGHAYYAFDTPDELEELRQKLKDSGVSSPKYDYVSRAYMKNSVALSEDEVQKLFDQNVPYVIRLKVPHRQEVKIKDVVRGWVTFHSKQLDDKVLLKNDGMPTYHLANVVDDHLMDITHVIRGEEWLPSLAVHKLLYEYLGWEEPQFAHLPLILKPDGTGKLSKRDGDRLGFPVFPINWKNPETGEIAAGYRESGYMPEAVLNILAMLGWNPGTEQEIFSKEELIQLFTLERVGKSGAKFDPEKAKWYNQQFLRNENNEVLSEQFLPILEEKGIKAEKEYVERVCGLIKEKASFIEDFWDLGFYFFNPPESYDEKVIRKKWKDGMDKFFTDLADKLEEVDTYNVEQIEAIFTSEAEAHELKKGALMQPFRVLLSGMPSGPGLFSVAELLGKEEVVRRIRVGVEKKDATNDNREGS